MLHLRLLYVKTMVLGAGVLTLSVLSVNNYFAFNVNAHLLSRKQRYSLFYKKEKEEIILWHFTVGCVTCMSKESDFLSASDDYTKNKEDNAMRK